MTKQQIHGLRAEASELSARLSIAQGHASDGDPSAQAEAVNLIARIEDINDELESWGDYLADMDHMARHEPEWFHDQEPC